MNWAHTLIATLIGSLIVGMLIGWTIKRYSSAEREKRAIRRKRKQRRQALRVLQRPVYDNRDSIRAFHNAMRQR